MPSALSRRVGPLPVWGWVVGALVAFLVISRRNRPGWFPLSVSVEGGPASGRRSFGAMVAGAVQGRPSDEDEDEREIKLTISSLGRDQLPSPLSAGGPDGTVSGGGGGEVATAGSQTIGLYGPGGMYTYTGTSRTRSGGSDPGSGGPIGYGGGRRF